ncbi:MAG: ATP-binding cassette domain-containing protein [Alphaproteobacteria bacterium]|nr:ATP-binding cassette domain-containing protein [Alphaproteobacteria bacterium]
MSPHGPTTTLDRAKGRSLGSLRRLSGYLRPYRAQVALALLALTVSSGGLLGLGQGLAYLIDAGLREHRPDLLDKAFLALLGFTLLLAAASYARSYYVASVGERVVADLRRDVYARLIGMDIAFFENTRTGELLSRLTTDTTLIQSVVGTNLSMALRNLLLLAGGTALLLHTSPKLTGFVFLMLPLVVLPLILLGRKVRVVARIAQDRIADLSAHAEETLNAVRTVQALALEDFERQRFSGKVGASLEAALGRISLRSFLVALVIALIFGAVVTVLWTGAHDVLTGEMTPGALSSFVFYAVMVASAVGSLTDIVSDLQRAAGAVERLMELLTLEPAIRAPANAVALPEKLQGHLRFEQVRFAYPSAPQRAVLKDISFEVPPGSRVALVGPSGSGKSTIFQLLLRFYAAQSGRISCDGIDISALDPAKWRRSLGVVPQEPAIFSASAWDNIRYGRPDASDAEVLAAARTAMAHDFLENLPEGYHTYLGEKGVRLSGGQKQRLAIARAILRNPQVLLLDEATSALDAENERAVQDALEQAMQGRTTLVIAHRLATVLKADRILVMEDGAVRAGGTHAELLETNPLYRRLATLQFGEEPSARAHAAFHVSGDSRAAGTRDKP